MIHLTLYSTLGCHLCEDVEVLLQQLQQAYSISWQVVDIMDLADDALDSLATRIPVLEYRDKQLNWPFLLTDIVRFMH